MTIITATNLRVDELVSTGDDTLDMVKRYVILPVRHQGRVDNVTRGFVIGLAEFGCLGAQIFDPARHPYENESDAILSDWQTLNDDMWDVIEHGPEEGQPLKGGEERKNHQRGE